MKTKSKSTLSAPFEKVILRKARAIAQAYDIVLRREDGEWVGYALEYPEAIGTGKTPSACIKDTREVAASGIAVMLETGQSPPKPARQGIRDKQINIRVSSEEKAILGAAAKEEGFRGVSDFVRNRALHSVGR